MAIADDIDFEKGTPIVIPEEDLLSWEDFVSVWEFIKELSKEDETDLMK